MFEAVVVGTGFLIIVDRDAAKRLFAVDGDEAMCALVDEMIQSAELRSGGCVLDLGDQWDAIDRCLTDGSLAPDGRDTPLNHCLVGGRQLHQGPERIVSLKRPDMIRHIAAALADLDRESFEEQSHLWPVLDEIRDFYSTALQRREATLFTASIT